MFILNSVHDLISNSKKLRDFAYRHNQLSTRYNLEYIKDLDKIIRICKENPNQVKNYYNKKY